MNSLSLDGRACLPLPAGRGAGEGKNQKEST